MTSRLDAILAGLAPEERLRQRPVKEWLDVLGLSLASTYRKVESGELGCVKHDGKRRRGGRGRAGKVTLSWEHVGPYLAARWSDTRAPESAKARPR